jgi:hypothetical protein
LEEKPVTKKSCFQVNIDSFDKFVREVEKDPSKGKISFKTVTEWTGGALTKTTARNLH